MSPTASRKAGADRAALILVSEAAQAFLTLLTPSIGFLRMDPTNSTATIRVRDSLHGVTTCVGVMWKLLGSETVEESESIYEKFLQNLADGASSLDSSEDVYNIVRPLLWSKTRIAYRNFVEGNDAAFDVARAELRSAIARGAS